MPDDGTPDGRHQALPGAVRIGRLPSNDVVVDDLGAARVHAELRQLPGGQFEIVDLDSHNGTYVNGVRTSRKTLTEQDIVTIGHTTFRLADGRLLEHPGRGSASLAAMDLKVTANGVVLLDGITFSLSGRSMMAIIGPTGTGTTALLSALAGKHPAERGTVLCEHRDLHGNYDELKNRIGLVPRQSRPVLTSGLRPRGLVRRAASLARRPGELTPRTALGHAAEARLPAATRPERSQRVSEVLAGLSMAQHADTRLGLLPAGQQDRVAIGLEMLTRPSLLFLDEPAGQLDASLRRELFRLIRKMTSEASLSVVLTTHDVEPGLLGLCDRVLVLAPGGQMAYFGPPGEGLRFFNAADWADVFQEFHDHPDRDWARDFKTSPAYSRYAAE